MQLGCRLALAKIRLNDDHCGDNNERAQILGVVGKSRQQPDWLHRRLDVLGLARVARLRLLEPLRNARAAVSFSRDQEAAPAASTHLDKTLEYADLIRLQKMRRLPRTTRTLLIVAVLLAAANSNADETAMAVTECPKAGRYAACLTVPFAFSEAEQGQDAVSGFPAKVFRVTGRFLNARERPLELLVPRGRASLSDALAYVGRSVRNKPIVLTMSGPLEITSGLQATKLPHNLFVVDTGSRWRVVGRHSQVLSLGDVHLTAPGRRARLWLKHGDTCVSAPQNRPGLLSLGHVACTADTQIYSRPSFSAAHAPDFDRLLRLIPELGAFRGGPVHENFLQSPTSHNDAVEVIAVTGTPYLIVAIVCNDCD